MDFAFNCLEEIRYVPFLAQLRVERVENWLVSCFEVEVSLQKLYIGLYPLPVTAANEGA